MTAKREYIFAMRMSGLDREALFSTAAARQQTPSEFLRDMIRMEARKRKLWAASSAGQPAGKGGKNGN